MGHITHTVIVVTSWDREAIKGLREVCRLNDTNVSLLEKSAQNNCWTFMVLPHGSKSGWTGAREADKQREFLKALLITYRRAGKKSPFEWFECAYGHDDKRAVVVDSEWTEHASTQAVRK